MPATDLIRTIPVAGGRQRLGEGGVGEPLVGRLVAARVELAQPREAGIVARVQPAAPDGERRAGEGLRAS